MVTIELTEEERDALLIQVGCRLDELKKLATESGDFGRIMELVTFIAPIQSGYDKLLGVKS
jgi:hypothetical protein